MNPADFTKSLENLLPLELNSVASKIATSIYQALHDRSKSESTFEVMLSDPEQTRALELLAGKEINLNNAVVSFGSGGQFGDIRFRDIVQGHIIHLNFYVNTNYRGTAEPNEVQRMQTDQQSSDIFTKYEAGLNNLIQRLSINSEQLTATLTYKQRLAENLHATRLFGDTSSLRSERSEIIYRLNKISLDFIGISFNEIAGL